MFCKNSFSELHHHFVIKPLILKKEHYRVCKKLGRFSEYIHHMEMESSESKWLKSVFREAHYHSDSPQPKRMKFSDVSDEIQHHFPEKKFTPFEISQLIQETFPNTSSKACGKARKKHILGLERRSCASTSEGPTTSASNDDLLVEIQQLKDRVAELEKKSEAVLCHQADQLIQHKSVVTQGPISLEAFHQFDLESIITELRSCAPDLYHLFMTLGDIKRNQESDEITTEEIKAVSSMCSTLNARSVRTKGIQLLLSMMLIARGTSRQV